MSVQHKRIASLVSIGLLVSVLGACKELQELSTENSDVVDNPVVQSPTIDDAKPDVHLDGHTDHSNADSLMQYSPALLNLKAMKINGLPVEVNLANIQEPWRVSNNMPAILGTPQINTLEFDFSNTPVFDSMIHRIEFTLRSMLGEKYFTVAINQLGVLNGQLTLLPETTMDVNYQDYMMGGYGSYGHIADSNMITLSQFKMTLDITGLMSHVGGVYPDKPIPIGLPSSATGASPWGGCSGGVSPSDCSIGVANHDQHSTMVVASGTASSTQFFTNDLYTLSVYYQGEMYYKGNTIQRLSNCVFASADTPPADISDICQAYLTVYK